jgi:hypothetical protein
MADPVKSDEIEDVLSSIRRLVTEHQPPVDVADTNEPGLAADKLVLTPALRVTDPEDPWVPITAQSDLSDEEADLPRSEGIDWAEELWGDENSGADPDYDPQLRADIWDGADTVAEPAPEVAPEPVMPEPVVAEAAVEPDESLFLPSDEAEDAVGDIIEAEGFTASAPELLDVTGDSQATEEEAPLAFIRSSSSVVDYEPEEGNTAVPDDEPPVATLELAEARAAQMAVAGVLSEVTADPAESALETIEMPNEADVAAEAEPAVEHSAISDDDMDAPDFLAEDAPDPVPETRTGADDSSTVEDLGESPFSFPDDDVSFVDEDTLREIISEVVREELQGQMGKRITRNIRKLVRREIRIALATDELED